MAQFSASPHRLRDIFPPGLDSRIPSQSSISGSSYSFVPEQLYYKLTHEYDPEARIESVLVNSIWYGKQKTGMRHEFILVEVEDAQAGVVNYIVLDRNKKDATGSGMGNENSPGNGGCSQSSRGPASDAFRVSYDGNEKKLLRECQLLPRQYVEKLEFDIAAEPLYLYQLVTLVNVISQTSNIYNLASENCYWFSGLLWECLRQLRPHASHINHRPGLRGKFGPLLYTPDDKEKQHYCDIFNKDIIEVEKRLKLSRQIWSGIWIPRDHSGHFTPRYRLSTYQEIDDTHVESGAQVSYSPVMESGIGVIRRMRGLRNRPRV